MYVDVVHCIYNTHVTLHRYEPHSYCSSLEVLEVVVWPLYGFCFQMSKPAEAISDCTKALELDSTYLKAYITRARWLVESAVYYTFSNVITIW